MSNNNNGRNYNLNNQDRKVINSQTRSYLEALNKQSERLFQKNPKFQDSTENSINNNASNFNYTTYNNKDNQKEGFNLNLSAEKTGPTNTNYDRDDSLNDVISFGKQTPFRYNDNSNMENEPKLNLASSTDYGNRTKDHENTNNNMSILNLKDTTMDEMFLIADDKMNRNNFLQLDTTGPNSVKKHISDQNNKNDYLFNRINLNPEFELSFNIDGNDSKFLQSTTRNASNKPSDMLFQAGASALLMSPNKKDSLNVSSFHMSPRKSSRNTSFSPSRIPVPLNRSKNLNDSSFSRNEEIKEALNKQMDKKKEDVNKNKINGAFKLFVSGSDLNKLSNSEISFTKMEREATAAETDTIGNPVKPTTPSKLPSKPLTSSTKAKVSPTNQNPRGQKQTTAKPDLPRKSKLPVKSPVRETIKAFQKNSVTKKSNSKYGINKRKDEVATSEQSSRPSTTVNINYSMDSDESMMMDNLINNPEELKKILREGKKEKEQLNQLQENYLHLLEQYAEKENFIDMFRLHGYNATASTAAPATPSANMFGDCLTLSQQQQQRGSDQRQSDQRSTTNSIQSQAQTPTINILGRQISFTPNPLQQQQDHQSNQVLNSTYSSQNTNNNLFIIGNNNNNNRQSSNYQQINENPQDDSYYGGSGASKTNSSDNNSNPALEENIVVEQNSKLGILLQTKVLEDKMQSFVTLMKEKQLNKVEQVQVFDSIKSDYENLLKNYDEAKQNDVTGMLPNELDMDIDLNKELGKMKDLLTDIVDKMSSNLVEETPQGSQVSAMSQEQMSSSQDNGSTKSVSSYGEGNHDELMDQYNRLLDVFNNNENTAAEPRDKAIMDMIEGSQSSQSRASRDSNQNQMVEMAGEEMVPEAEQTTFRDEIVENHEMLEEGNVMNGLQNVALKSSHNVIQSHQVQIKNGRSPKRTKQLSTTTDSLSSESNNSSKNLNNNMYQDPNNNILPSKILPTPVKSSRHSKKVSKTSHHDSPTDETTGNYYNQNNQHQHQHQHQQQQYKQNLQNETYESSSNQFIEIDSQQASYLQLHNNNQYIGNQGNNRQQQSTKYSSSDSRELASDANQIQQQHQQPRKPKLVRVSKEQPFISESDFTLDNNSNMVMEINNQTYDKHQPTMIQTQKVAHSKKILSSSNGKAISKSRPSLEDLTYEPEQIYPHVYPQQQQQQQQKECVPSRHSKTSTQSKSSSSKQQQAIFNQHGDHNQMNSERIALSDEDEATSKTEIISFTKEDYILQKMLENTENSSSSSSSDRMVLNKKKEELRLKKLLTTSETRSNKSNSTYSLNSQNGNFNNNHQNHRNGNKHNMMPVARAYDGSEDSCPEDLDTISRFPAEEELFGSIHNGKEMIKRPILQQNRYTIHEEKERQYVEAAGEQMMAYPIKTKSKQHRQVIEPEAVIYENNTIFSEGSESMTEVDSVIEVVKSKKLANDGGATHGTNGNGKNQSKNEIKKELMKRLTDEVEHLKQHILKKHLKKVIKSEQRQEAANVVVESAKAYVIPVKTKKYNPNVMIGVHNSDNYIAEELEYSEPDTEVDARLDNKHLMQQQQQAMEYLPQKQSRRRQHDEYWTDSNKDYNRMKSSKSLENFDALNNNLPIGTSYYTKNKPLTNNPHKSSNTSSKYLKKKSQKRYDSIQELDFIDPRQVMQKQPTRSQDSTDTRSNGSHRSMKLSRASSQSTEQLSSLQRRYMYDSYGRSMAVKNSIHTSSQQIPYALNEIDQNVLLSSKSKSHSTKHLNHHGYTTGLKPAKSSNRVKMNSEANFVPPPYQPMMMPHKQAPTGYSHHQHGMQRNYIGLSESNLLSNHLYTNNNYAIPENQIGANVIENRPVQAPKAEKRPARKVRYYIREYGDVSAASDNEAIYRSSENDIENSANADDGYKQQQQELNGSKTVVYDTTTPIQQQQNLGGTKTVVNDTITPNQKEQQFQALTASNQNVYAQILNQKIEQFVKPQENNLGIDLKLNEALLCAKAVNIKSKRIKKKVCDKSQVK